ncbi:MAG: AzlC family ABC transporter permease [Oscillospiraceae bacterium]|nr:AzlC family ABC transporter permease [Oscillospiraceae bacterium]
MKKRTPSPALRALAAAFPQSIPIMTGFLFLGMTYGILARSAGLSFWHPALTSTVVYAGSMEFLTVGLLTGAFAPLNALALTLLVNARHLFYGISMLDKYRDTGAFKPYLIFGLSDETFSVNCSAELSGIDRKWFYFFVTLLDQLYWMCGVWAGAAFGSLVQFNTEGLDFVMTAMFVVIFINQWKKEQDHTASLLGLGLSLVCLLVFGAQDFVLPAMLALLAALSALRPLLQKKEETV